MSLSWLQDLLAKVVSKLNVVTQRNNQHQGGVRLRGVQSRAVQGPNSSTTLKGECQSHTTTPFARRNISNNHAKATGTQTVPGFLVMTEHPTSYPLTDTVELSIIHRTKRLRPYTQSAVARCRIRIMSASKTEEFQGHTVSSDVRPFRSGTRHRRFVFPAQTLVGP